MDNDDLNERRIYHKRCNVLIELVDGRDKQSKMTTVQSQLHHVLIAQ